MSQEQINISHMQCWLFRMAQSKWNKTPEETASLFNLVCVSVHCFSPQPKTLTLKHLKSSFCYPHNERIGSVCRGRDHWWKITEEYLAEYGLNGYYERFIQADILKSGAYLNEKAKSKESLVSRTGESK